MIDELKGILGFLKTLTWTEAEQVVASLIGALVGAWAGAWAARKGAAADKEREMFLGEIRAANAAYSLCFSIINNALNMKKQHVLPMVKTYEEQHQAFMEIEQARTAGKFPKDKVVNFLVDMQTLPTLVLPTDELRRMCLEKLTLGSRPMAAVQVLHQCAVTFDESNRRRARFIEQGMADRKAGKDPMPMTLYFGLPDKDGHVNREWPDTLTGIHSMLDDVIYFTWLLSEDLATHGEQVSALYRRRYGRKSLPVVRRADFAIAKAEGIMPNDENYKDWMSSFPLATKKTFVGRAQDIWRSMVSTTRTQ